MGSRKKWYGCFLVVAVLAVFVLGGCKREVPIASNIPENVDYTKAQAMLVVATERNRYEKMYTDAIWQVALEDGRTFEEYLLEQIRIFLRDLKTMNMLADSREITLGNGEKDRIRRMAETYYNGLGEQDIQYMGVTLDDVVFMYQQYHRANKVVGELTQDVNLEVSDSDAKVILVRQIVLDDKEQAELIRSKAVEGEKELGAAAREVTDAEVTERQMQRGQEPEVIEEEAFALESGQVSQVVEVGNVCYLFQCVSDYEIEATKKRKTQIQEERRAWVFQQIYDQFQEEHQVTFSEEIWADIHFSEEDQTSTDNFFALYQEEFGGQGY